MTYEAEGIASRGNMLLIIPKFFYVRLHA